MQEEPHQESSPKNLSTNGLLNMLLGIWNNPTVFKVEEFKPRIFQIFLVKEKDLTRMLSEGLWIFHNSWFILKRWEHDINLIEESFKNIHLWIQMRNLPIHFKTIQVCRKVAVTVGKVIDSRLFMS